MLFSVAFGVPEKSVFTRLFCVFATVVLANFQDRLVMTASISLRVDYLIVLFLRFFLAFRILDRDHFGQVFYRLKNGVFWTSFGGRRLASSRGRLKFQDRLVMTASICLRMNILLCRSTILYLSTVLLYHRFMNLSSAIYLYFCTLFFYQAFSIWT